MLCKFETSFFFFKIFWSARIIYSVYKEHNFLQYSSFVPLKAIRGKMYASSSMGILTERILKNVHLQNLLYLYTISKTIK